MSLIRYSHCITSLNTCDAAVLRQLKSRDLIVLNGQTERGSVETNVMIWYGTTKSVLDLAIVPNTCSADIQAVDV